MIRKDEHWFVQEDPRSGPGYEYWPVNREQLDPRLRHRRAHARRDSVPVRLRAVLDGPQDAGDEVGRGRIVDGGRRDLSWRLPNLAVYFGGDTPAPSTPLHRRELSRAGRLPAWLPAVRRVRHRLQRRRQELARLQLPDARPPKGADIRVRHDVKEFEPHPKGGYVVRYSRPHRLRGRRRPSTRRAVSCAARCSSSRRARSARRI